MAILFDKHNQLIIIESPDAEVTIQELINAIRQWEDDLSSMDIDKIADASGKEDLGGGVSVGLTLKLLDWKVQFEARPPSTYVTCNITGGNLVAVDDLGATVFPVEPSAYVTVTLTSSSSATATSQTLLEHGAYQDRVVVDTDSSYTYADMSDSILVGTHLYPVNNLADAKTISDERGFHTVEIMKDMTVNSGTNLDGFTILGQSQAETQIVIDTTASTANIIIRNCNVTGVLDGGTILEDCLLGDVVYFNGFITHCAMVGTIYLGGGKNAVINDCLSSSLDLSAKVDVGGFGQGLLVANYTGIIIIENSTGTDNIGIGLNAGRIVLDSTITGGNFILSGMGNFTDNSTSVTSLDTEGLLNTSTVANATWDKPAADHMVSGSFGELMNKFLLRLASFIGLK